MTAALVPRRSETPPASGRASKVAAACAPITSPTTIGPKPRRSCTNSGMTGSGAPMVRYTRKTLMSSGSSRAISVRLRSGTAASVGRERARSDMIPPDLAKYLWVRPVPSVRRQLRRARGALLGGAKLFQHRREIERYSGSLTRQAVDCQSAAMLADQTIDDAEAETGAALLAGETAIYLAKRKQGHRSRLRANNQPDDDRVEAEAIVHEQRNDRQRRSDGQVYEENADVEREQPRDQRQVAFGHRCIGRPGKGAIRHDSS